MDLLAIIMVIILMVTFGGFPGFGLMATACTSKSGTRKHVFQGIALSIAGVVSFWGPLAVVTAISSSTSIGTGLTIIMVLMAAALMVVSMVSLIYVGEKVSDKIMACDSIAFTNAMLSRYTNHTM